MPERKLNDEFLNSQEIVLEFLLKLLVKNKSISSLPDITIGKVELNDKRKRMNYYLQIYLNGIDELLHYEFMFEPESMTMYLEIHAEGEGLNYTFEKADEILDKKSPGYKSSKYERNRRGTKPIIRKKIPYSFKLSPK